MARYNQKGLDCLWLPCGLRYWGIDGQQEELFHHFMTIMVYFRKNIQFFMFLM
jgi:hypothetical protein